MSTTISETEALVLAHTARTGRYCTGEAHVIAMGASGLLRDHGPQALAGGAHCFTMSARGREALATWRASLPKPPKPKRWPAKPVFAAWRTYCEICRQITFGEFVKKVWPERSHL